MCCRPVDNELPKTSGEIDLDFIQSGSIVFSDDEEDSADEEEFVLRVSFKDEDSISLGKGRGESVHSGPGGEDARWHSNTPSVSLGNLQICILEMLR